VCIALSPSPDGNVTNLHAFWDVTAVKALGHSAPDIATKLDAKITPADITAWSAGGPRVWAMQSFAIAKRDAYNLPTRPTCAQAGAVTLSPSHQATAEADAAHQLSVAGVRLAYVLNGALGDAGR
jgi:S1/P1 Nuclease